MRKGMTLVELLVATTITVLIAGSAIMVFRSAAAARKRIDRHMSLGQEARAGIDAIATALRNAYRPSSPNAQEQQQQVRGVGLLEGVDESIGDAPADRIRFMTVSHRTIRTDEPESDVREVEFFLDSPTTDRLPALMRRTDPTLNPRPDGGGVAERIAANIAAFDIEYHDGQGWIEEWSPQLPTWPTAIRVRLAVVSSDTQGSRETLTVTRLIGFHVPPPEEPKEQQPTGARP